MVTTPEKCGCESSLISRYPLWYNVEPVKVPKGKVLHFNVLIYCGTKMIVNLISTSVRIRDRNPRPSMRSRWTVIGSLSFSCSRKHGYRSHPRRAEHSASPQRCSQFAELELIHRVASPKSKFLLRTNSLSYPYLIQRSISDIFPTTNVKHSLLLVSQFLPINLTRRPDGHWRAEFDELRLLAGITWKSYYQTFNR